MNKWLQKVKIDRLLKATLILAFLSTTSHSFGQDFELLKFNTAFYPMQSIEDATVNGEIGVLEWSGELAIPQPLSNKKTIFIHKVGYANVQVNSQADTNNLSIEGTLYYHGIWYDFGWMQKFNPKWSLFVNVKPTLASDFGENLNENDFLLQANAMLINTKKENLKYGFGVTYDTRFGRQRILPIGLLKYNTSKMELDVLLPLEASLMFNNSTKKWYYGLEMRLNGGVFNNFNEVALVNTVVDEVGYSRLNAGPAVAVRLKDRVKILLSGGISVGRRFELIDVDENIIDRTPEPSPYLRLGVSLSPKKKG